MLLEIEPPGNDGMDDTMGKPNAATVLLPTVALARFPRGVIDDYIFPSGRELTTDGNIGATVLANEDDSELLCVAAKPYTSADKAKKTFQAHLLSSFP